MYSQQIEIIRGTKNTLFLDLNGHYVYVRDRDDNILYSRIPTDPRYMDLTHRAIIGAMETFEAVVVEAVKREMEARNDSN